MEWAQKTVGKVADLVSTGAQEGPQATPVNVAPAVSAPEQEDASTQASKPAGSTPPLRRSLTQESLTPSIRDLFDHGPGLVERNNCWATFCLHFERLLAVNVGSCTLLPRENESLIKELGFGNRAAQFIAWRFSLLNTGVVFFAFITVIEILLVADIWGTKGQSFIMEQIDPRYRGYFDGLTICNWIQSIGFLLASIAAVIFAGLAALQWKKLRRSRKWVAASWVSSYLPPFLLLLVIPFRSSVDFEGIQAQMCRDVLNSTSSVEPTHSWLNLPGAPVPNHRWPGKVGRLADTLLDAYSIRLPSDLCDEKSDEWGSRIREYISDRGLLARSDGTCGFSDTALQTLGVNVQAELSTNSGRVSLGPLNVDVGVSQSDCPASCLNCTGTCLPHIMRLTTLANLHGEEVLSNLPLGGVAEHCVHCISRSADLLCQYRCPDVALQLDRQAILGVIPSPGRPCFQADKVRDFELLLQLGTQTAYWRMLLGLAYAALSLTMLLPLAFSLMLGAAKGATIAKSLIPYSRVPTVISTASVVFTFPFVFMIMILIQNIVGTWLTLVGIILVLIAFLASMKPGTLKAESTAEMQKRQEKLGKIGALSAVLALIVFLVVFGVSDLGQTIFDVLQEQELSLTQEDLRALGSQTTWMIVNTVCGVFGKSLISTVFFSDAVVSLMYRFHKGEDEDPFSIQCARTKLVGDLETVFKRDLKAVTPCGDSQTPSEDSQPPVSSDDLAKQNQAMMMAKINSVAAAGKFQQAGKFISRVKELERIQARLSVQVAARQFGSESAEVGAAARSQEEN